jgi:hypothetical protein
MPKKKTTPTPENTPDKVENIDKKTSRKPANSKVETPVVQEVDTVSQEISIQKDVLRSDWILRNRWYMAAGICVAGLLLGFLVSYIFQVRPLQDLLSYAIDQRSTGEISSNQIKSDLSNTRLRQQEMEIRYLTAAARLESANQYIILLRMKDQVSLAHLFVVEKDGLEARKALAEIRTLFDQLQPYIVEKDAAASNELDDLIFTTVQDLTNDPESAASDLTDLETHLDKVEAALFQME